ncbi:hypothetical protein BDY21DRAFT_135734 [Lineolata rhizophorae]|uniref:C2H2-type domain-containing protein n=1 Tax=Lineolata rhizophorae TaxID=578093 RepID=A0A6A6PB26_9PEZI|nr:hypothetical protein BDY21DRAFT_135734 [Lineolata rhizophorae]
MNSSQHLRRARSAEGDQSVSMRDVELSPSFVAPFPNHTAGQQLRPCPFAHTHPPHPRDFLADGHHSSSSAAAASPADLCLFDCTDFSTQCFGGNDCPGLAFADACAAAGAVGAIGTVEDFDAACASPACPELPPCTNPSCEQAQEPCPEGCLEDDTGAFDGGEGQGSNSGGLEYDCHMDGVGDGDECSGVWPDGCAGGSFWRAGGFAPGCWDCESSRREHQGFVCPDSCKLGMEHRTSLADLAAMAGARERLWNADEAAASLGHADGRKQHYHLGVMKTSRQASGIQEPRSNLLGSPRDTVQFYSAEGFSLNDDSTTMSSCTPAMESMTEDDDEDGERTPTAMPTPLLTSRESTPPSDVNSLVWPAQESFGKDACRWMMKGVDGRVVPCGHQFSSPHDLHKHVRQAHLNRMARPYVCMWAGCKGCGEQTQKSKLERHLCTHTKYKPFVCQFDGCGQAFTTKQILQHHVKTHQGTRDKKCELCDYTCTTQTSLQNHIRAVHTKEKPYKCNFPGCDFRCSDSSNLSKHAKTHNKRVFKCPHPGCASKAESRLDNFKRHLKTSGHCPELLSDPAAMKRFREAAIAGGEPSCWYFSEV